MTSQKAMLHHVLKENRFNPSDFEIVPSTAQALSHEKGDQVRLKGTEYYFSIYPNESEYQHEKFFVEYSPGKEEIRELELCGNWEIVCYTFAQYLGFLAREITTDDPWADAKNFSETLRALPETAEAPTLISEAERKAILIDLHSDHWNRDNNWRPATCWRGNPARFESVDWELSKINVAVHRASCFVIASEVEKLQICK